MMKHALCATLILIALGVAGCGIKGPLQPPSADPALHDKAL